MKISVVYPEIEAQLQRMGASLSTWQIGATALDPREMLLRKLEAGIELSLADVEVGPGGLLTYKGEQVLLYIKDTRSSRWTLENEPEKSRRFHVKDCVALERMRAEGRFDRYVNTIRMDGKFLVHWLDPDTRARGETEAELKVCKDCLRSLNWRGYAHSDAKLQFPGNRRQTRKEIWEEFSISSFLLDYSTFFRTKPSRRDNEASLNVYVENWPRISEQKRRQAKWRCELCAVDLSAFPNLLHCHHRSGVVTDNSSANLMVLCAVCHSEQPSHQHMRIPTADRAKILSERVKQKAQRD